MAKKFIFPLETVLNHRLIIEEERKKEFSMALNILAEEEKRAVTIQSHIDNKVAELALTQATSFSSIDFFEYQSFIAKLSLDKKAQYKKIEKLKYELEEKRNRYIEATKNTKVIQKLKENQKAGFMFEQDRLEQLFLDEIAISKFALKHENNGD